ncbi:MAG: hypothetical protein QNI91_15765 [Arenicellales bacterium]|nr:hypothetical protein [Arenicellales bacterium]
MLREETSQRGDGSLTQRTCARYLLWAEHRRATRKCHWLWLAIQTVPVSGSSFTATIDATSPNVDVLVTTAIRDSDARVGRITYLIRKREGLRTNQ